MLDQFKRIFGFYCPFSSFEPVVTRWINAKSAAACSDPFTRRDFEQRPYWSLLHNIINSFGKNPSSLEFYLTYQLDGIKFVKSCIFEECCEHALKSVFKRLSNLKTQNETQKLRYFFKSTNSNVLFSNHEQMKPEILKHLQ